MWVCDVASNLQTSIGFDKALDVDVENSKELLLQKEELSYQNIDKQLDEDALSLPPSLVPTVDWIPKVNQSTLVVKYLIYF